MDDELAYKILRPVCDKPGVYTSPVGETVPVTFFGDDGLCAAPNLAHASAQKDGDVIGRALLRGDVEHVSGNIVSARAITICELIPWTRANATPAYRPGSGFVLVALVLAYAVTYWASLRL